VNYYQRHLGDYAKDTSHLSMLEHGAYTLLLDRYYSTDGPIPADQAHRLTRAKSREERAAVDVVLAEFFELIEGCWSNRRAEEELGKANSRIEVAQANGKRGGRKPRTNPATKAEPNRNPLGSVDADPDDPDGNPDRTQQEPTGLPLGSENGTQKQAIHSPVTNNQKTKTARGAAPSVLVSIDEIVSEGAEYTHARDWLAYRKSKGHALTPTAWAQTKAQAVKAKLTIAQVVEMLAGSQWMGFRADWMLNPASNPGGYRSPASPTATVPSNVADETSAYLEAQANRGAVRPPSEVLAALNKLTAKVVVDATDPVSQ
jgi:uncharacterized protein YdaU (DUF1376 family)